MLWAVPLRGRALVELGDIAARSRGARERPRGAPEHPIDAAAPVLLRPLRRGAVAGAPVRPRAAGARRSPRVADATNQHAYDSEQRRLAAEVCLARGDHRGCEALYQEALAIARAQGARCARTARLARLRVVSRRRRPHRRSPRRPADLRLVHRRAQHAGFRLRGGAAENVVNGSRFYGSGSTLFVHRSSASVGPVKQNDNEELRT